jgi:NADH:ubiquinone oxidoreductase subunit 4 (subunit M)
VPGFANFAGEITVLFGVWSVMPWHVVVAAWGGLVIGGVYMLRAIRKVAHGEVGKVLEGKSDAEGIARVPYLILLLALVYFGVVPGVLVDRIRPSAERVVALATAGSTNAVPAHPVTSAVQTPAPAH